MSIATISLQGSIPGAGFRTDRPLIIGSAQSVRHVARLLREHGSLPPAGCIIIGARQRRAWRGPRMLGKLDDMPLVVRTEGITLAYLCLPLAMHSLAARIARQLSEMDVAVRRIPTVRDQLDGRAGPGNGHIDPADLLARPPRPLDHAAIAHILTGKRVLITGAGGSIGSHIATIVARFAPQQLMLMERAENNLFEIDRRLAASFPTVSRRAMLHDVTDAARTQLLLQQHRPQVIFHAAAHKHVPMMEDHPREAVVNNFFGTRSIADAAHHCGAERFVMISTDKAVNPSSVMGATKRMAELYVQHLAGRSDTLCSMVRFGNVLGSACSVIPIWTQQLAEGGPLTVTDPRMTRFFMTIPEAAALVIQAATLEESRGSIFVLDMGEPIHIQRLAERFIELSGLVAGEDVQIVHTGARPGEKLHEELSYAGEDVGPTSHTSVRLLRTTPPESAHIAWMLRTFESLRHTDGPSAHEAILAAIRQAVPQMTAAAASRADEIAA